MRTNIETADKVLGKKYKVLDHGWVSLVDYCGGDEMIENFARTSYGQGTRATSDRRNLIRYLIRNHHSTPIESTELSFSIALPIHVARQLVRHRTFSPINEYSARYSEVPEVIYDKYSFNLQSKNNKQGRKDETIDAENESNYKKSIMENQKEAFGLYNDLLQEGVAREIARMHLPLNTYTYWFCKMDLNNLLKMLKLRCDSHAQEEIRQYAFLIGSLTKLVAPLAFEAWYDYAFAASNWTRLDKQFLHNLNDYVRFHNQYEPFNLLDVKDNQYYISKDEILKIATEVGMSKRELDEFWKKLEVPEYTDFTLDNYEVLDVSEDKE